MVDLHIIDFINVLINVTLHELNNLLIVFKKKYFNILNALI